MERKLKNQIVAVLAVVAVAIVGSVFVNLGMEWFGALRRPSQWLPNFVIPIVWTVIYLLVAIYLVVELQNERLKKETAWLFVVNGVLNVLWCLVFFTLNLTFLGAIVIILNLAFGWILYSNLNKNYILPKLLLIYPLWLSIATGLNVALWILN